MKVPIGLNYLLVSLLFTALSIQAQNKVSLSFGSLEDTGTETTSYFGSYTDNQGFNTPNALMAFGYFNSDDTTLNTNITNFQAGAFSLSDLLDDFNQLHFSSFDGAVNSVGSPGFLTPGATVDEAGVGKTGYIMTLHGSGVTDWGSASNATEIGLFTDTAMSTIIAGGDPSPTLYADGIRTSYDRVLLGETPIEGFDDGAPWVGNMYLTQALPAQVPEPSTYALLLGAASFGFVYYRRKVASKKGQQATSESETVA